MALKAFKVVSEWQSEMVSGLRWFQNGNLGSFQIGNLRLFQNGKKKAI